MPYALITALIFALVAILHGLRIFKGWADVRFGSKADMCNALGDVRFTPNSGRNSGHR